MKITQEDLQKIIEAGQEVHTSYTILHLLEGSIKVDEDNSSISINGGVPQYEASNKLTDPNTITIKFEGDIKNIEAKRLDDYTDADKIALLQGRKIVLKRVVDTGEWYPSIVCNGSKLGGIEKKNGKAKKSLWDIHIESLRIILDHFKEGLKKPEVLKHAMLAAMATGSGKSVLQGILGFIMLKADITPIFITKDNLTNALRDELTNFFPKKMTKKFCITSHKESLGGEQAAFPEDMLSKVFVMIDEAHEVDKHQDWQLEQKDLARKLGSMLLYLTATIDRETLKECGGKATIGMSIEEKVAAGISVPPIIASERIKSGFALYKEAVADYNARYKGKSKVRPLNFLGKFQNFIRSFFDKGWDSRDMQKAVYLKLKYELGTKAEGENREIYDYKEAVAGGISQAAAIRKKLMFDYRVPIANGQSLIITDSLEFGDSFYENFNIASGESYNTEQDAATLSGPGGSEEHLYPCVRQRQFQENLLANLAKDTGIDVGALRMIGSDALDKVAMGKKSMKLWAKASIIHGVIENALSLITGHDFLTLERMRFNAPKNLFKQVIDKVKGIDINSLDAYFKAKKLPEKTRDPLVTAVTNVINYLSDDAISNEVKQKLVENWIYEAEENIGHLDIDDPINTLVKLNQIIFLFGSKNPGEKAKIGFQIETQRVNKVVHNEKLEPSAIAYPPTEMQYSVSDKILKSINHNDGYIDYPLTEDEVDALVKNKLCPNLITDQKTEGFNVTTLKTVVYINNKTQGKLNTPPPIIQGFGRLRNLLKSEISFFLEFIGREVKTTFSATFLLVGDYLRRMFTSQDKLNAIMLEPMAKEVAEQIKSYIAINTNADQTIDKTLLASYVYDQIIHNLINKIDTNNSYNLHITRSQLKQVLKVVYKELKLGAELVQRPYTTTRIMDFIGNLTRTNVKKDIKKVRAAFLQANSATIIANKLYDKIIFDIQGIANSNKDYLEVATNAFLTKAKIDATDGVVPEQKIREMLADPLYNRRLLAFFEKFNDEELGLLLAFEDGQDSYKDIELFHHFPPTQENCSTQDLKQALSCMAKGNTDSIDSTKLAIAIKGIHTVMYAVERLKNSFYRGGYSTNDIDNINKLFGFTTKDAIYAAKLQIEKFAGNGGVIGLERSVDIIGEHNTYDMNDLVKDTNKVHTRLYQKKAAILDDVADYIIKPMFSSVNISNLKHMFITKWTGLKQLFYQKGVFFVLEAHRFTNHLNNLPDLTLEEKRRGKEYSLYDMENLYVKNKLPEIQIAPVHKSHTSLATALSVTALAGAGISTWCVYAGGLKAFTQFTTLGWAGILINSAIILPILVGLAELCYFAYRDACPNSKPTYVPMIMIGSSIIISAGTITYAAIARPAALELYAKFGTQCAHTIMHAGTDLAPILHVAIPSALILAAVVTLAYMLYHSMCYTQILEPTTPVIGNTVP